MSEPSAADPSITLAKFSSQTPTGQGTPRLGEISPPDDTASTRDRLLAEHRWLPYVLPFVVFMVIGALEPMPPGDTSGPTANAGASSEGGGPAPAVDSATRNNHGILGLDYSAYPAVYTLKILLTLAAIALVWPAYPRFPARIQLVSIIVGVAGVAVWILLTHAQQRLIGDADGFRGGPFAWLAGLGQRSAYNPLEQMSDRPTIAYGFLAVRLFGLAVVVPIIEEFFLRGFVMRFVMRQDWWNVPFGAVNAMAIVVGTALPMMMHPAEILAALAWFSGLTWLMIRTRSLWDCVAAHSVTNLLLGGYVLATGEWLFL